ncbi:ATP-binding protein [Rickettsia africae]|uniref:ATP-binding protein n=1 Tax=Rickettsia africae TaxID=35788 RepID=UPI00031F54F6|nr:ATP-binding protein [Rickettsia africae]
MFGPPGTGKSRLAACLPSILPKMSTKEILECSTITSVAGKFLDGKLLPKQGRVELHIIHAHWPLWSVAVSEKK